MPSYYNNIFGWTDYTELYSDSVNNFDNCTFLEVGSFQGKSICYLAEDIKEKKKNITLISVDLFPTKEEAKLFSDIGAFQGEEGRIINELPKSLLDTFADNIRYAGVDDIVIPIKSSSEKAAKWFSKIGIKFAMIYIDAGHNYDTVYRDLELYLPLVEIGGWFMGHDATDQFVNKAIKDFFGKLDRQVEFIGNSWRVKN